MEQGRTILLFIDITERELLQEQLIRTQKLESIGILAGGIAHNFNNALTGVMGFISLAARQLDPASKAAELLQRAEQATKRSAALAKQLLTFAQGGAPHKKALSLARLVDESVAMALNGTNVRYLLAIPDDLHFVMGDEDQLNQVFSNLAINAVHAMPAGGTLTVRAENFIPEAGQTDSGKRSSFVTLSISDSGCGIPAANLTRIFEPYFTTNPSSTGLGLASVYSIVHKHGGRITAASEVGVGTTFTLLLPSTTEAPDQQKSADKLFRPALQGNTSVLVMDDEQTIREISLLSLEFLGYRATACENGEQAVAAYRAAYESGQPFMAAILDLTIPGAMGGLEASRQILAFDPAARLIVSSGYSLDPVMSEYSAYGFCAAVAKPYRADALGLEMDLIHAQTAGGRG